MNPMLAMMMFWSVVLKGAKDPLGAWGVHAPAKPAARGGGGDQDAGTIPDQTGEKP